MPCKRKDYNPSKKNRSGEVEITKVINYPQRSAWMSENSIERPGDERCSRDTLL